MKKITFIILNILLISIKNSYSYNIGGLPEGTYLGSCLKNCNIRSENKNWILTCTCQTIARQHGSGEKSLIVPNWVKSELTIPFGTEYKDIQNQDGKLVLVQ